MSEPSLLTDEATPFERAQSETDAARYPQPAFLVKDVWNPARCPVDLLPYMAAGFGLEIWDDNWPEARKREIVAEIWRLKRNKTKSKGIAAYLDLVGASLVSAHRPRDKRWWSGAQTDAQRAATFAAMPRIRLYPSIGPAAALPAKGFWGGRFAHAFWGRQAWVGSDAAARWAGRAAYVDGGVSTPVTVRGLATPLDASLVVEFAAGASVAKGFWGGRQSRRFWGSQVWFGSDADSRVLTITPTQAAPNFAVPAGLVPTAVRPVQVAETVPVRAGQRFWGRSAWAPAFGAYLASDADSHVFAEVVLFDGSRLAMTRQPYSFWGYSRWGRPAYTAELHIDVALTRGVAQFGWTRPWGRRAFWGKASMSPLWRALEAIRISQAYRDTIWVDTRLYAPIQFSPGLRFGERDFASFGQQRKLI